jgi:predicted MPP superfamily phosphohydrolase
LGLLGNIKCHKLKKIGGKFFIMGNHCAEEESSEVAKKWTALVDSELLK